MDGETLETCNGIEFSDIKFEESLPNFVVKRLAEVESYVAFLGSTRLTGARVEQLLMLAEGSKDCIPKPELI
ncbi:peptidyl-prolyl cis-trans isomerase [Vibrio variabilis]|uniref:Peptidyl-prolyl cis-trans isomerase n=1 Tax=Vibrio variabilis TaxID=990271 RepID=A0ABQ0JCC6_9VIBR|nr:peptidyl-prolyl cis-trans isomerase [Vibrio variabilis]